MKENKDTSWGNVAKWYDDLLESDADSYQEKVILPNLIRLVDPKKGMTILDLACGQGFFSRTLNEKGAKVIGCDVSKELIELAKKNSSSEIAYYVSPANNLSFVAENATKFQFDAAIIILALQNIEDMVGTLSECARVLKPGGRLFVVLNHPAFRIPGRSSWQWDQDLNKQYRRLDGYMSDEISKIDMNPGETNKADKKFTVSIHRPLQAYFKALEKTGFVVKRLEEWISHKKSQNGPRSSEEDRLRKEIPMFLCLETHTEVRPPYPY